MPADAKIPHDCIPVEAVCERAALWRITGASSPVCMDPVRDESAAAARALGHQMESPIAGHGGRPGNAGPQVARFFNGVEPSAVGSIFSRPHVPESRLRL